MAKGMLEKRQRNDVFVACFATSGDQLSQWRGYGADGFGYTVGFEPGKLANVQPFSGVAKVLYDEKQQKDVLKELVNQSIVQFAEIANEHLEVTKYIQATTAIQELKMTENTDVVADMLAAHMGWRLLVVLELLLPLFKNPGFVEEQEVRLFSRTNSEPEVKQQMKYTERRGILVPHIPISFTPDKIPIRRIVVGPNLDFDQAEWSLRNLLNDHGFTETDVEIVKSKVPYIGSPPK
jgi:hypothetical protein